MCCIIHRPKDAKEISELDKLRPIIRINSDGWGVSYFQNGALQTIKSLDMSKAIEKVRELESENIEFLFHARYATHGDKNLANCHPYNLNNGVLFHNGKIDIPCQNKKLSDTHYFSLRINKWFNKHKSIDWILNRYKKNIGPSRFAVMSNDGTISKFGNWHEVDGCNYSKLDWRWDDWGTGYAGGYSAGYNRKYTDYQYEKHMWSTIRDPFEEMLENCKNDKMIFNYLAKQLSGRQLTALAMKYPKLCAEFLSRTHLV